MTSPSLPARPSLRHLKLEAKSLLKSARKGDERAVARIRDHQYQADTGLRLTDAQHALAREYGFSSWPSMVIEVERRSRSFAENQAAFLEHGWVWGDQRRAKALIAAEPSLANGNIFAAATAGDLLQLRQLIEKNEKLANELGGPRQWPPLLYLCWSCLASEQPQQFADCAVLLLTHGADPNCSWHNHDYDCAESALYGACAINRNLPLAKVLLDAGASPNDGETLYHASEHFDTKALELLAGYGLDADDVSYCLKHKLDFQHEDGVRWFLDHGADPNAVHPEAQETSLHWAVKRGASVDVVALLLKHGADPNARTKAGHSAYLKIGGRTPLDFALRLGHIEVAELLAQNGAVATPATEVDQFLYACMRADEAEARRMCSAHTRLIRDLSPADVNLVSHAGQFRHMAAVRLMIELGFDIHATGWMEATPLHWAVCHGDLEMVLFLLERGSQQLDAGGYFNTPLHTAVHCQWNRDGDYAAVVKVLLDAGATIPDGFFPTGNETMDACLAPFVT